MKLLTLIIEGCVSLAPLSLRVFRFEQTNLDEISHGQRRCLTPLFSPAQNHSRPL